MALKKPDNFFKLFLASIIIGSGAKIEGYPVLDEFLIIMILFGLFFRKFLIKRLSTEEKKNKNYNLHEKAFMLLIIYFLFQSLRGGIWLEDPRMLRWVIFFIIIAITFFIFSNLKQTINPENVNKIVLYSATIYFLLLFILSYIYELLTGKSKAGVLQDLYISGSTVSTFTIVIYVIALITFNQINTSIKKNIKGLNLFVFLSFIIVTSTTVYYDSRAGIFTILGALGLNFLFQFLQKNKRGILQFFLIVSFLIGYQFWAINYSDNRKIQDFLPIDSELNLAIPENLAQQNEGQGRARLLAPKASFNFIKEDLFHALFGYGWYMSRYELIEPIQQMRKHEQLIRLNISKDKPYNAAGAIALMVDTGFIGIFLYLLNLYLGFLAILKSQNKNKYVISIVYLSVVLFSFVGTLTSVLLFYFWVMPKNPVILMLEKNESKT
tara:strand:+ start:1132 stop:2445 length:1314 start_codon:yes stop_codon:yes gene_type:complete